MTYIESPLAQVMASYLMLSSFYVIDLSPDVFCCSHLRAISERVLMKQIWTCVPFENVSLGTIFSMQLISYRQHHSPKCNEYIAIPALHTPFDWNHFVFWVYLNQESISRAYRIRCVLLSTCSMMWLCCKWRWLEVIRDVLHSTFRYTFEALTVIGRPV